MFINKSIYKNEEIDVLMPIYNSDKQFLIHSLESLFIQNIKIRLICILNGMSEEKNLEYISFLNQFKCDILLSPKKGIANSLKSSLKREFLTKSLKMGKAAFEPVSYLPNVFGVSKPT